MNFFEAQERARKSSRLLVWWFILSVAGVILVMYLLAVGYVKFTTPAREAAFRAPNAGFSSWWNLELMLWTAAIVGGVIVIGSLFKLFQLSGGGKVVARDLGGRQVEPSTTDLLERRLLNVVEEMAIASGVPVPEVWIMDEEQGINAFAAGTDPSNAVIGVTRGTLERLTRSELQGVVAHEFSHILNGDMKLNMRLMGWIFGLVMLSMLGRILLESFRFMRGSRDSKGGGVVFAIVLAGIAIWIVGGVGVLFARMLQAAISRQREYLADASAVQFTRDSGGIAGALKKIGGFSGHGNISSSKATEARHMFFAGSGLSLMMATHPPLEKRILALEPNWKGEMLTGMANPVTREELRGAMGIAGRAGADPGRSSDEFAKSERLDVPIGGEMRESSWAGQENLFSKQQAKALMLGLLLPVTEADREKAAAILRTGGFHEEMIGQIIAQSVETRSYSSAKKLALVDLSLTWLRKMSQAEARDFVRASHDLVAVDGQLDLFEFMLQMVIERHVSIGLGLMPVPAMKYRRLGELEKELGVLLGAFADLAGGGTALSRAAAEYREHTGRDLPHPEGAWDELAQALKEMDRATPLVKQQILRLCDLVATEDGIMEGVELELLRATAEAIGASVAPVPRGKPSRHLL